MNHVALIGRLTRDPQANEAGTNCRFSIAVDRGTNKNGEKEADFPNIVCFGKQAESCMKYLQKGRLVGVEGRIRTGSYTNKDGNKVYTTDVVASRVEFLEWGDKNQEGTLQNSQPAPEATPQNVEAQPAPAQAPANAQPAPAEAPQNAQPAPATQQETPAGFQETDDAPAW